MTMKDKKINRAFSLMSSGELNTLLVRVSAGGYKKLSIRDKALIDLAVKEISKDVKGLGVAGAKEVLASIGRLMNEGE